MSAQVYRSQRRGTPSPSYHQLPDDPNPFSSVHRLSDASSARGLDADGMSIMTAPPPYSDNTTFIPTVQMQIETTGKPLLSLPIPLRPDPIPVYTLDTTGGTSSPSTLTPTYISLHPTRGSGSCFLINPSLPTSDPDLHVPLSTTHYRFGPGRHPRVRLFTPRTATPTTNPFLSLPADENTPDENNIDLSTWDSFELLGVGLLTRAITFRTRLGTFTWRYASRKERKAINVSSLLVLDRVVKVAQAQNLAPQQKDEEIRTPVAHFARNDEFRTEGSSSSSAGNGGRLLIDLRIWSDEEGGGKTEREMAVVMVVTTCLAMLKKEVDRRRAQQIAIMAGAASGGS